MPYGYLISAVLATLCTLVAYTGPRRPFALGLLSLFLGVVYNEAPLAAFVVLAASVSGNVGEPGLGSAVGWTGSVLFLLTAAGLIALALRGARTDRVIDAALEEGLGEGWRARAGSGNSDTGADPRGSASSTSRGSSAVAASSASQTSPTAKPGCATASTSTGAANATRTRRRLS